MAVDYDRQCVTVPTSLMVAESIFYTDNTNLLSSSTVTHRTSSHTRNPLSKKRENDTGEIESGIHEFAEIYRYSETIQGEMLGAFVYI